MKIKMKDESIKSEQQLFFFSWKEGVKWIINLKKSLLKQEMMH